MKKTLPLIFLAGVACCIGCKPTPRTAGHSAVQSETAETASSVSEEIAVPTPETSLLRVSIVSQEYSQVVPWQKESPGKSSLRGIYLGNGRVLIPDAGLRAANMIEISLVDGSRTVPGRVVKVDSDAGLGIIEPLRREDFSIFEGCRPLSMGEPLKLGDTAEVWDTARGGLPLVTPVTIEEGKENSNYLPQVSGKMGQMLSENTPGLPLVKDHKLVGMADGYTSESQLVSSLDAPVIRRFIESADEDSPGVPLFGISTEQLVDPVFRSYLKLDGKEGGVYISKVSPRSAAETAGVKEGDVLISADGATLDSRGLCRHPRLGPLSWVAMLRGSHVTGESVELGLLRQGEPISVTIGLNRDAEEKGLVKKEKIGAQPRYIMRGGLLFQVASADYLKVCRERSNGALPYEYLTIERDKEKYLKEGRRELVLLTLVLPTPAVFGYDDLYACVVDAINDKPVNSLEEAAALLDEETPNGMTLIRINKPPYVISFDRNLAEASDQYLRLRSIPVLRHLNAPAQ